MFYQIPTANIKLEPNILLSGVYAVSTIISGNKYNAVANIGYKPTFSGEQYLFEANILINDQLKNEAEQGLNDLADFLYEILKTQKNSYKEWREFKKNSVIPKNIPKRPDLSYDNEWKGWGDFLGKEK